MDRRPPSGALATVVVAFGVAVSAGAAHCRLSRIAAPPAHPDSSARMAPASGAARVGDVDRAKPCPAVLRHNSKLLGGSEEAPELFSRSCWEHPGGVWALRANSWEQIPRSSGTIREYQGTYSVFFFEPSRDAPIEGVVSPSFAEGAGRLLAPLDRAGPESASVFDFDGDDVAELLLRVSAHGHEDTDYEELLVLRVKGRDIEPYPGLPAGVDGAEDVDNDGRPDLIYYPYRRVISNYCTGGNDVVYGPSHVAHSRPDGSFLLDDEVAIGHLRKQCEGAVDDAPICARILGRSAAHALALLRRQCKPLPRDIDGCNPPPGFCHDYADREADAKADPPVRVPSE